MTLTLDFQGQFFNSHILGMGRLKDLEWKGCNVGRTMGLLLGHSAWQIYIGQVMGQCETLTVSNLLAHEWTICSLI